MPQQLCGTQLKPIAGSVCFDADLCLGGACNADGRESMVGKNPSQG